jgi:hypothetical protein
MMLGSYELKVSPHAFKVKRFAVIAYEPHRFLILNVYGFWFSVENQGRRKNDKL